MGRFRLLVSRILLGCATLGTTAFAATIVVASPAAALSCAAHRDGSAAAIATGTERLSTGDRFFERYDAAIIGRVVAVDTNEQPSDDYGATAITVDVAAVLGERSTPTRVEVSSPDPGWMAGHPYEVGRTYLIPVQHEGPDGRPNSSFVCDPISEIAPDAVDEIVHLATDHGIEVATPDADHSLPDHSRAEGREFAAPPADEAGRTEDRPLIARPAVVAVLAAVAAVALAVGALRHLTRSRIRVTASRTTAWPSARRT